MVTQAPDAVAIKEFAEAVGDWLLTQRFGQIQPLAYRHRIWEPRPDDRAAGERPHVVIELVVEDAPPRQRSNGAPSPAWLREDRRAVRQAARECALTVGVPPGIDPGWPIQVDLFGRSDAATCGIPAP